jgi:hypothetical protein
MGNVASDWEDEMQDSASGAVSTGPQQLERGWFPIAAAVLVTFISRPVRFTQARWHWRSGWAGGLTPPPYYLIFLVEAFSIERCEIQSTARAQPQSLRSEGQLFKMLSADRSRWLAFYGA